MTNIKVTSVQADFLAHQKLRMANALSMFRPAEHQEEFFLTFSMNMILEIMLGGGNRCLHGSQEIYDPVAKVSRRVDDIDGEFHVESKDPLTGESIVSRASEPFLKGFEDFYTVTLSNGKSFVVTLGHQLLSASGAWVSLGSLVESLPSPLASTSDTFLSGFRQDAPHSTRTTASCSNRYDPFFRPCGGLPLSAGDTSPGGVPLPIDAQERPSNAFGHADGQGSRFPHNRLYRFFDRPSILGADHPVADQSDASRNRSSSRPCSPVSGCQDGAESQPVYSRSAAGSDRQLRTSDASAQLATRIALPSNITSQTVDVVSVVYHSTAPVWDIHVFGVNCYCLSGVLHHNSGKSLSASAAFAAFLLNQPITFNDGRKIHMRPERWRHEAVKAWVVGFDWDHIGSTCFRLLFKPDAFRIFRDLKTKKWRAWNPNNPGETIDKTKPAPAFIQYEEVLGGESGMSWENKKENQVSSVNFKHDGTRVEFYPSTGAVPMGDPVHLIWIDEHINDESWYSELMVRLIDYQGRLFWTAWADTAPSSSIMEARERAEDQNGKPDQTSFAFTFKGADNPFTRSTLREKIMQTMDAETRSARDEGVPNSDRWRVYSRFSKHMHRMMNENAAEDDPLAQAVRSNGNQIPPDWTRYVILDPGTTNAAVLFVAVPPPSLGDYIVPYDEFYVPKTSARPLAEAIAQKTKGIVIEDLIADPHACRQTPMGFSKTVGQNYEEEFAKAGVTCRRHGSRLSYGSDDVDSRILRTQATLNVRGDGTVRLRVLMCFDLTRQMLYARWGSDPKGNPINKPSKHQKIDLVQALEYFVSRDDCGYFKPPVIKVEDKTSREAVMSGITTLLGKTNVQRATDRSVYCGAGEIPHS